MRLRGYPAGVERKQRGELDAGSTVPGEEQDQRDQRQHEDHRMDDHTARDRDDEKNNTKYQKHGVGLPGQLRLEPTQASESLATRP